jgi:hypothetical protein
MNYAKLLEMNSIFTLYIFLEVGKTQDLPSKIWQTLGDALKSEKGFVTSFLKILKSATENTPCFPDAVCSIE